MIWEVIEVDKMKIPGSVEAEIIVGSFNDKLKAELELKRLKKNCNPEFESFYIRKKS